MRRDLNGLRVVVTGATSGIGRELAEGLAAGGAEVLAVGRDRERLRQVAGAHPGIRALEGSLETIDQRLALRDAILEAGPVDVLINNAGTQTPVDARAPGPWAVLATEIEVNLSAPIHLSHLLLPALLDRSGRPGDAAIVNVTSGLAMAPKAASAPYCATKAGLRSYTKALRWQLRAEPILIVEALPPIVRTHDRGTQRRRHERPSLRRRDYRWPDPRSH